MKETNNHKSTALLVMDVQDAIVNAYKENSAALLNALVETINTARKENIPVIYVIVGFREGYPEVSSSNKTFSMLKNSGRNLDTAKGMQVDARIAPQPGDMVVIKKRISAFTGSDLEVVLRSKSIHHLVLTGIATSGVVLSTVREAADKDYRLTVLADCCYDSDAEVHSVLTTKVFPRQADVMDHQQWITNL